MTDNESIVLGSEKLAKSANRVGLRFMNESTRRDHSSRIDLDDADDVGLGAKQSLASCGRTSVTNHAAREATVDSTSSEIVECGAEEKPGTNSGQKESENMQSSWMTPKRARFGEIPPLESNIRSGGWRKRDGACRYTEPARLTMVSVLYRYHVFRSSAHTERPTNSTEFLPGLQRGISWSEATNARPPLRIDMDGPTACTYNTAVKPLGEVNAPRWTFGTKCGRDKDGGGRTSWEKQWFQSPHVWHYKTDFAHDRIWPSPGQYQDRLTKGLHQITTHAAPAFSVPRCRHNFLLTKPEATPGPGTYNPISLHRSPSFYISSVEPRVNYTLGPYASQ